MDKLTRYRRIVRDILTPIAQRRYSTLTLAHEAVFDDENNRYLVMSLGWEGTVRRVHHCLIHVDIIEDKIWIQRDGTEEGITCELEAAGIPRSDIVLGFHSEQARPHTGYATA